MTLVLEDELWNDFFTSKSSISEKDIKPKTSNDCKGCGNNRENFFINSGDLICINCGLVQESSIISDDPEWNNYVEDGVVNGSGIRCGNILDSTNPYDTGNTFVPNSSSSFALVCFTLIAIISSLYSFNI